MVYQLTGDYPAALASRQQSLTLYRSLGHRPFQATALNGLGELATRSSATRQARDHHAQALTIARDTGMPFEGAAEEIAQARQPFARGDDP